MPTVPVFQAFFYCALGLGREFVYFYGDREYVLVFLPKPGFLAVMLLVQDAEGG